MSFAELIDTKLKATYVPNDKVALRNGHYGIDFKLA